MSIVRANKWQSINGLNLGILQTVRSTTTFVETNCSTTNTWTDCGVSAVITPLATTSKLIVNVNAYMLLYTANVAGTAWAQTRVKRNGTVIGSFSFGGLNSTTSYFHFNNQPNVTFVDTPNTTAALTYTFEVIIESAAISQSTALIRTKFGNTDGTGGGFITVTELAV